MDNSPRLFPPPSRNWWQRNWLWLVPTGCLSLLVALALFVGGILTVLMSVMRSSEVYKTSVQRARTNAQVADALGTPLDEGWWMAGNINLTPQSGNTNLSIPIAGPGGKGTIYVVATKTDGQWIYPRMDLRVDGTGQRIDLLSSEYR